LGSRKDYAYEPAGIRLHGSSKAAPVTSSSYAAIKTLLPKTVTVGEAIVWINPNDPVVSGALAFRVFERDEISFFSSHFSRDMTLIDVGANVGLYTGIALSTKGFQGKTLSRLGFTLYELPKKDKGMVSIDSPRELISRTQGRKYRNLIGLKGRFAERNAKQGAAPDSP
jgi:hypothetical protein